MPIQFFFFLGCSVTSEENKPSAKRRSRGLRVTEPRSSVPVQRFGLIIFLSNAVSSRTSVNNDRAPVNEIILLPRFMPALREGGRHSIRNVLEVAHKLHSLIFNTILESEYFLAPQLSLPVYCLLCGDVTEEVIWTDRAPKTFEIDINHLGEYNQSGYMPKLTA